MKRFLFTFVLIFASIGATLETDVVTIVEPVNGSVVSGTIQVTALAPLNTVKVEFYRDGVLIKTVYNLQPQSPENLIVIK